MKNIYLSKTERNTLSFGRKISRTLMPGDIVCLFGNLGSGKTLLTKGIAQGFGLKAEQVHSPTFTLMNIYSTAHILFYHFDLYRIKNPRELLQVGYEEFFYGKGITIVEWADRLGTLMPKERLTIQIQHHSEKQRLFCVSGSGKHFKDSTRKIFQ